MKKLLVTLASAALLPFGAYAQSSISSNQSNYNITGSTGSFNVTFTLATTATNISSFDLFLQSNSPGVNNVFTITNTVSAASGATPATTPQFPDQITTTGTANAGFAQNQADQGFAYSADKTITGGTFTLETLTISYNFGSVPAPGTSFTFATTASNAASRGTYFYSNNFANQNTVTPATFTVTVVPEPSTWSLLALSGILCAGVFVFRNRSVSA